MSVITVKCIKPEYNSKLGFSYTILGSRPPIVTNVSETSLFHGTDLREGHEILTINGTCVTNIGAKAFQRLLEYLPKGEVTLEVDAPPRDEDKILFGFEVDASEKEPKIVARMKTDACPGILQLAGVSDEKWSTVHALVQGRLMPMSLQCVQANDEFEQASTRAAAKGTFVTESNLVLKAVDAGTKACVELNHATLAATVIKDRVNALLSEYGVMTTLVFDEFGSKSKKATGMKVVTGLLFFLP